MKRYDLVPQANIINHMALVLDASDSMRSLMNATVKVADLQVSHLAQRSKELDQETRMTVYTFNTRVDCVYYDKDVLRLPSLAGRYRTNGMTALIDATHKAIDDLEATATLYGDHAFLVYVLTDGQENSSRHGAESLRKRLNALPDNWTVAVLVPNVDGVFEAKRFGFSPNNITQWDTSERGVAEVGETIRTVTDNYMTQRSLGVRGTRNLFTPDTSLLSPTLVEKRATKLLPADYHALLVAPHLPLTIREFVENQLGTPYRVRSAFYELVKPETVQPTKDVILRDKVTRDVFSGRETRKMIGLPDYEVRVAPADHPNYDIFIQSTSVNRRLVPGTDLIVLR